MTIDNFDIADAIMSTGAYEYQGQLNVLLLGVVERHIQHRTLQRATSFFGSRVLFDCESW